MDRRKRRGGGVCVYVREHINISRVQFSNVLLGAEFIWLKFFVDEPPCSSTAVYICCCYNPPKPVYNSQDLVNMLWGNCEEIVYIIIIIVIAGDLNRLNCAILTVDYRN